MHSELSKQDMSRSDTSPLIFVISTAEYVRGHIGKAVQQVDFSGQKYLTRQLSTSI